MTNPASLNHLSVCEPKSEVGDVLVEDSTHDESSHGSGSFWQEATLWLAGRFASSLRGSTSISISGTFSVCDLTVSIRFSHWT